MNQATNWNKGFGNDLTNTQQKASAILKDGGLNWEVESQCIDTEFGLAVPSHRANVRTDCDRVLGVVGENWKPIQNSELVDFALAIADDSSRLKVANAGTIKGGKKVWIMLDGGSFEVLGRPADTIGRNLLISNGFDGKTSLRVTPSSIRDFCFNIFNDNRSAVTIQHTGLTKNKIAEAKRAIESFGRGMERIESDVNTLAARDVTDDQIKAFFMEAYQRDFGAIPTNPKNKRQETARGKALDAFRLVGQRFEAEESIAGANWWNVFNAYSGYLQHDRRTASLKAEETQTAEKLETAFYSNMFDASQKQTVDAFQLALTLSA